MYEDSLNSKIADDATVEQKDDCVYWEDSITEEMENIGQRNTTSEKASIVAEAVNQSEPKSEAKSIPNPKGKRTKDTKKSKVTSDLHNKNEDVPIRCATCSCEFQSRNKLFEHLKVTGHAKVMQAPAVNSAGNSRSKKEKRKNR